VSASAARCSGARRRSAARADAVIEAANAEVRRVLDEWAAHVGAERLDQLHDTLRDLRELTDPWR